MTTPTSSSKAATRDPMEVYLERLEERDRREKKYKKYIDAFQAFADKTAARESARIIAEREAPEPSTPAAPDSATPDSRTRPKTAYYPSFRGKSSPTPSSPGPIDSTQVAQLRADLATANTIRAEQEAELKIARSEVSESRIAAAQQAKQLAELEKANKKLEHRVANTTEEATRQRDLAREAQDEMLALQVEVNAEDKKLQKVEADNKELVDRWMTEKGEMAQRMNDAMEKGQKGPKKR